MAWTLRELSELEDDLVKLEAIARRLRAALKALDGIGVKAIDINTDKYRRDGLIWLENFVVEIEDVVNSLFVPRLTEKKRSVRRIVKRKVDKASKPSELMEGMPPKRPTRKITLEDVEAP
ncbi:MAG: hypothetical protein EXS05_11780 [Planctomycetaceae bacterium]|nr:hypothetical protein [Planctomycetaceae bacterium]